MEADKKKGAAIENSSESDDKKNYRFTGKTIIIINRVKMMC